MEIFKKVHYVSVAQEAGKFRDKYFPSCTYIGMGIVSSKFELWGKVSVTFRNQHHKMKVKLQLEDFVWF